MSQNRLVLDGLAELRAALQQLPEELRADGSEIVMDAAEITKSSLIQSYPLGDTGNLRGGVTLTTEHSAFGTVALVRSRSPHAHLWEFGTQDRHTRQGWNRGKGPEHTRDGLVAIASRNRKRMYQGLISLLQRAGFQVSGTP